jgi:two-component system, NtrC family, sensor kinase
MGGINMKMRRRETVSPKRSKAPRTSSPRSSSASDLQKQLDQRTRELAKARKHLAEALQQQTATSEVLKVISRSTFDLQAVLNTLTESVARLCEADMAAITRQKGTVHYWATSYGLPPELSEYLKSIPLEPGRGSVVGRTQLEGKTVHIRDVLADPEYTALEFQRRAGFRTVLGVPLLREGSPIGVIVLLRSEVRHRQADRADDYLRRPSGDRDRERPTV